MGGAGRKNVAGANFLKEAFLAAQTGILFSDREEKIVGANPLAAALLGCESEELAGLPVVRLFSDGEKWTRLSGRLATVGKVRDFEAVLVRSDRSTFDALVSASVFGGSDVVELSTVWTILDITDRKLVNDALAEHDRLVNRELAAVPDPLIVIDVGGIISDCNAAAVRFLKCSGRRSVVGQRLLRFVSVEGREAIADALRTVHYKAALTGLTVVFVGNDGEPISGDVSASAMRDDSGAVCGNVISVRAYDAARVREQRPAGPSARGRMSEAERRGESTASGTAALPAPDVDERWLTISEVADYLGIRKDTAYKWLAREKMPGHKFGRLWRFKKSEVDAWFARVPRVQ